MKRSVTSQQPWVAFLRSEVRQLFLAPNGKPEPGWFIGDVRGSAYLQHRVRGQSAQIVKLPYAWSAANRADIFERVKKIRAAMLNHGLTLQGAAQQVEGRSSHHVEDWAAAVESFRVWKQNHGKVSAGERTWRLKYAPHLDRTITLMQSSKPPPDARSLLETLCS